MVGAGPVVLDEVELLVGVDLTDFASDVHGSEDVVDFAHLFFDFCEERSALEGAADGIIPIPGMLPEDFLIPVVDEVVVAVALGNEQYKLAKKDVIFVYFLQI